MRRPRNRLRIAQVHLSHWGYYELNINVLSEREKLSCKILFYGLKHISNEDREFLAEKYRVNPNKALKLYQCKYIPDGILAEKRNLTLREYRKMRIDVETRFNLYLLEGILKFQDYTASIVEDLYKYEKEVQVNA
ncbi:hypothetical protein ACTWQB_09415 [Piscibacillus sp. B03]|uniref:hypothetical protein n=1 Tax=Piscibacillus sp. B03 TaxID=3457430 RepID=UPI003FCEA902